MESGSGEANWVDTAKVMITSMVVLSIMAVLTVMFLRKFPLVTEEEYAEQAEEIKKLRRQQKKKEEIKVTLDKINKIKRWLDFQQASLLFQTPNLPPSSLSLPGFNYMLDQFIHTIDTPPPSFMFTQPNLNPQNSDNNVKKLNNKKTQ